MLLHLGSLLEPAFLDPAAASCVAARLAVLLWRKYGKSRVNMDSPERESFSSFLWIILSLACKGQGAFQNNQSTSQTFGPLMGPLPS